MKDITVALELTLPCTVSDQQIKSFIEDALKEHLQNMRNCVSVETNWDDGTHGVHGINEHMIDVVYIIEGQCKITLYGDAIIRRGSRWRSCTAR